MIRHISPKELRKKLDASNDGEGVAPFLLDVREPREFELCRIEGSVLIPLGQLQQRADEVPDDREIVAICHHGSRSLQAAAFLQQARGLDVINLSGGVAAWADQVDPAMKRY